MTADAGVLKSLGGPVAAAMAVRIALFALITLGGHARTLWLSDSVEYLALAGSLWDSGTFVSQGQPNSLRPPLYPLLLVPGVATGIPLVWGFAINLVASLAWVVAIAHLARAWAGDRAGRVAAWIAALEPTAVVWSLPVLADLPFAAAVAAAMITLGATATAGPRAAARGGALLGVAAWIKAAAYPATIAVAPLLAAAASAKPRRWAAAAALAGALIVVAPWHLRNYLATGNPVFSTHAARALLYGAAASGRALAEGRDSEELRREEFRRKADRSVAVGLRAIAAHPVQAAVSVGLRAAVGLVIPAATPLFLWTGAATAPVGAGLALADGRLADALERWRRANPWLIATIILFGLVQVSVLLLAARGAWLLWPLPAAAIPAIGLGLYFAAIAGLAPPDARLRLPAMIPALALAGAGIAGRRMAREAPP